MYVANWISRQILLEAKFALNRAISAILKKSVLKQNSFELFSQAGCADDENDDNCGKVENFVSQPRKSDVSRQ